ncbi:hypothetical protein AVEN_102374-1, partial [Araneus ventricosus]
FQAEGQTPSRWCGAEVWRGVCQIRRRPRHVTAVQNEEVSPKIAFMLLQNGTSRQSRSKRDPTRTRSLTDRCRLEFSETN